MYVHTESHFHINTFRPFSEKERLNTVMLILPNKLITTKNVADLVGFKNNTQLQVNKMKGEKQNKTNSV